MYCPAVLWKQPEKVGDVVFVWRFVFQGLEFPWWFMDSIRGWTAPWFLVLRWLFTVYHGKSSLNSRSPCGKYCEICVFPFFLPPWPSKCLSQPFGWDMLGIWKVKVEIWIILTFPGAKTKGAMNGSQWSIPKSLHHRERLEGTSWSHPQKPSETSISTSCFFFPSAQKNRAFGLIVEFTR